MLTGRSNLAGANGPNRLVRDDDLFPVVLFDSFVDSVELLRNDLDGRALLSLFQALSATEDDADTARHRSKGLLGDEFVLLSQDGSPFGVAKQCPCDARVFELLNRDLACEGSIRPIKDILSGHLDGGIKMFSREKQVERWRRDDDFCIWVCIVYR